MVSKTKLSVLYLATLGLYAVYWFYANWKKYRDATGQKLWPIPRAIFYIFFTHSLFKKVNWSLSSKNIDFDWAPNVLATIFVILSIAMNLIDRLAYREVGSPTTDFISIALLPAILIILLKAQHAINLSQDDEFGETNRRFTVYNYLWIILGIALWLLVILGLLSAMGLIHIDG